MNMKDRSIDGKIYRIGISGKDIRTGLSRRSGGRWWGSRVCWLTGTAEKTMGSVIPSSKIRICTFPILAVLENDRLGGWALAWVCIGYCLFGPVVEVWSDAACESG